jgi:chaperone required for assembly of F1-ATPase
VSEKRNASSNPMDAARRLAAPPRQKRFYKIVEMRRKEGGFALRLDGKRAMTPGRRPLAVPNQGLADAIAAEWDAQGENIDPVSMPVTRLANSAIDGVAERREEVRSEVLAYAGADLLCYRAERPGGLVRRQDEIWNPIVAWAETRFGAPFTLASGIVHVAQPRPTMRRLSAELDRYDEPFRLAGLSLATTLTGSALIALAMADGAIDADAAWAAAHVDEDWNISQWGEDADAAERRSRRRADFDAAALALAPEIPSVLVGKG